MQKEFVKLSVNDIHPYPNNPRINDEAVGGMLRRRQKATHMAIIDLMKRKADADRNS